MIEFVFGAFTGYVLGRAASMSSILLRKPDKILIWDANCLGYRPIHPHAVVENDKSYLMCYEVKSGNQER